MIQIYDNGYHALTELYNIFNGVYNGVHYETRKKNDTESVSLKGVANGRFELPLSLYFDGNRYGDKIFLATSVASQQNRLLFGMRYLLDGAEKGEYFADGEMEHAFIVPSGASKVRFVCVLPRQVTYQESFSVKIYKDKNEEFQKIPVKYYYKLENTYRGLHHKGEIVGDIMRYSVDGKYQEEIGNYITINLTYAVDAILKDQSCRVTVSRPADINNGAGYGASYKIGDEIKYEYYDEEWLSKDFTFPAGATEVKFFWYQKAIKKTGNVNWTFDFYIQTKREGGERESYDYNGIMTLLPTSANVHAELNGTWSASLVHPVDDEGRWEYIQEDRVVKMPSFNGDQLFRIRKKTKSDTKIEATMEPIFFDSMDDCWLEDVRPTRKNGQQALDLMLAPNKKYGARSDITRITTAYYQSKNLMEAINGDDENSFINRWGGEILFDNFDIVINNRVGGDYGVALRYGKNIPLDGLSEEVDTSEIVTRIYPKAYNGYTMTGVPYVDSPLIGSYPTIRTAAMTFDNVKMADDAGEDDEDQGVIICGSQAELNEALTTMCRRQYNQGLDKPKVSMSADMVLLKDTDEYQEYQVLEEVSLGDTIHCIHNKLGIVTNARVIALEYDSIAKSVTSVELGDFTYNYFNSVSSAVNRIDSAIRPDGTVIGDRIKGFIDGAMAALRAQSSVAKRVNARAILFEDLDEDSYTYGALAMGTKGLEIADKRTEDGKEWDWTTALTGQGLIANIIVAGILSDKTGSNYLDLDHGTGRIGGWNINQAKIYGGDTEQGEKTAVMQRPGNNNYVFAAGGDDHTDYSDCPFRVSKIGNLYAQKFIGEGSLTVKDGEFIKVLSVDGSAYLYIDAAELTIRNDKNQLRASIYYEKLEDKYYGNLYLKGDDNRSGVEGYGFYANGYGTLIAVGRKARMIRTKDYGNRLEYCYEMPNPMFGDIGSGKTDEKGECYIFFDTVFKETVNTSMQYYVFLQKEGEGDLWIAEKTPEYFVVKGDAGIPFSWEVKSKQRDFDYLRLEDVEDTVMPSDEIDYQAQAVTQIENYIKKMGGIK